MRQTGNRKSRRGLWGLGLAFAGVSAWTVYKLTSARAPGPPTAAERELGGPADLSRPAPGAAQVDGQPWDIGTGVAGYAWPAPEPRAALLLQHGYGEYAQRFV